MAKFIGVKITGRGLKRVSQALEILASTELLIGFPEKSTERDDQEAEDQDITNATLAYIHDNGAPEQNIPARPFMDPTMKALEPYIDKSLNTLGKRALDGGKVDLEKSFVSVGITIMTAIKNRINDNIPPPLSPRTIAKRLARKTPRTSTRTLVDTGAMRHAVNFVIRSKRARKG